MIFVRSSFVKNTSVDGVALDIIDTLKAHNFPFRIHSASFIDPNKVPSRLVPFLNNTGLPFDNEFQLVVNPACFLNQFGINDHTIIYTVWDSTLMDRSYAFEINKARLVMVPSQATKECLLNSGVRIPIEVVPLGINPGYFRRNPRPANFPCVFGSGGQIVSEQDDKKALDYLIRDFKKAFPDETEVFLKIKTDENSLKNLMASPLINNRINNSRVEIYTNDFDSKQMRGFYNDLSCFVNTSRYEAFGLMIPEALSCGVPVITTHTSAIKDYFKPEMGYIIGHQELPSRGPTYKEGNWFYYNSDELISTMRYVYENRSEVYLRGYNDDVGSISIYKTISSDTFQRNLLNVLIRFAYV